MIWLTNHSRNNCLKFWFSRPGLSTISNYFHVHFKKIPEQSNDEFVLNRDFQARKFLIVFQNANRESLLSFIISYELLVD